MKERTATLYSAAILLQIARDGVRESEHNPLASTVGIVFSALSLEAIVNELLELIGDSHHRVADEVIDRVFAVTNAAGLYSRQAGIENKIHVLYSSLTGLSVAKGQQPYQDLSLLIKVRNFIVHSRPEIISTEEDGTWKRHQLVRALVSRGVLRADHDNSIQGALGDLQTQVVARWAYDAMVEVVQAMIASFPSTFRDQANLDAFYGHQNLAL
jgi:hypothetical protein